MISRQLEDKLKAYKTPFYLYDIDLLNRTVAKIKEESSKHGYVVHYSMKANFDRRIMESVLKGGIAIDCVSGNEIKYALEVGFKPSDVVFEGVGKRDDEIEFAIDNNIFIINCESKHEIEIINQIAASKGKVVNIGLRLNPNIDAKTNEHLTTGRSDCKFGISKFELKELFAELKSLNNIAIKGLHFHIGSSVMNMEIFRLEARKAQEIYKNFLGRGFDIKVVNMGGGLGIDYNNPEKYPIADFESYFSTFAANFTPEEGTTVHFELGRSVVAQCGELISRVLYKKTNESRVKFAIIDAGMTELIRPALYGAQHSIENISGGNELESCVIAGNVCESSDTFAYDITLPELKRGDLISIKSAGAYGSSMASNYNMHSLPQAVYTDEIE